MAATTLLATSLKALFLLLTCSFCAVLIWASYAGGNPYWEAIFIPWMPAAVVEYNINFLAIALWIVYKESSLVVSAILVVVMWWAGSLTVCCYIFIQFLKLSPAESAQDPIYHVLLRHEHKSCEEQQEGKHSSVIAARIGFSIMGCLLIASLIYCGVTDGSPFRKEALLSPWLTATVIDVYFHTVALSAWVVYKETSWLSASVWMVLFICFGGIASCGYILLQLFQLGSQDPLYLVLLKNNDRATGRVPLLSSV